MLAYLNQHKHLTALTEQHVKHLALTVTVAINELIPQEARVVRLGRNLTPGGFTIRWLLQVQGRLDPLDLGIGAVVLIVSRATILGLVNDADIIEADGHLTMKVNCRNVRVGLIENIEDTGLVISETRVQNKILICTGINHSAKDDIRNPTTN